MGNFTVHKGGHRGEERVSSGRNRTVDGVDVIGVRSVSEAAENQSFLRTAFTQCLSLKRAVMMTGLAGCSFTCKVMRVGEKVGGGGVLKRWSRMRNLSKENMFLFSVSSLSLTVLRHVCYFLIHSKGGMAVRYTVAQSKRYKQTERKAHMVQSVY